MTDGVTVLIRLKNVVFEWSGYFISIFRIFRRPRRKATGAGDKDGFPVVAASATAASVDQSESTNLDARRIGDAEEQFNNKASRSSFSNCSNGRHIEKMDKNGVAEAKNPQKRRLSTESNLTRNGRATAQQKTTATIVSTTHSKATPNQAKNLGGGGLTAGLQKNLRKICLNLDSSKVKHAAVNKAESSSGWVCEGVVKEDVERLLTLPAGVDEKEWIATHVLAFFHHVNALYGSVSEFCTLETCPVMNGKNSPLLCWIDEKGKKCKYPAQQYVDCVMSTVDKTIYSEDSFPTKFGNTFPAAFDQTVKKLTRLLYTVLDHLIFAHEQHFELIGVLAQAKIFALHFCLFADRFDLLDAKSVEALRQSIDIFDQNLANQANNGYCNDSRKVIVVQNLKLKEEIIASDNLVDDQAVVVRSVEDDDELNSR